MGRLNTRFLLNVKNISFNFSLKLHVYQEIVLFQLINIVCLLRLLQTFRRPFIHWRFSIRLNQFLSTTHKTRNIQTIERV